ncbi:hypothetical protein [Actinophytocola sp.]|uniref:hypothetical protein n=1 Tax=Actinophytocola sp. TaxID=1872138 RepID=UPI003D6B59E2
MDDLSAARALALVQAVLDDVRHGTAADVLTGLEVLLRLREEIAAVGAGADHRGPRAGGEQGADRAGDRGHQQVGGAAAVPAPVGHRRDHGRAAGARGAGPAGGRPCGGEPGTGELGLAAAAGGSGQRVGRSRRVRPHPRRRRPGPDDPATLLADAHAELREGHAALADEISSLTDRTDQLRQDTRDRRDR